VPHSVRRRLVEVVEKRTRDHNERDIDIMSDPPDASASASSAGAGAPGRPDDLLPPFVVRVGYRLDRPGYGVHFLSSPNADAAKSATNSSLRQLYAYTVYGDTSSWLPTVELLEPCSNDRWTFDLSITCDADCEAVATGELVPSRTASSSSAAALSLAAPTLTRSVSQQRAGFGGDLVSGGDAAVAVGTAASSASITDTSSPARRTFVFRSDFPLNVRSVGFVVAPLIGQEESHAVVHTLTHTATIPWSVHMPNYARMVKQRLHEMKHTSACVDDMLTVYQDYLGTSYPLPTYRQVFVEDAYMEAIPFAGLSVLDASLLHDRPHIHAVFRARYWQAYALAWSWVSIAVQVASVADAWIPTGIAAYLAALYLQKSMGINEREFERLEDVQFLSALDTANSQVLRERSVLDLMNQAAQMGASSTLASGHAAHSTPLESASADYSTVLPAFPFPFAGTDRSNAGYDPPPLLESRPLYWTGYANPVAYHNSVLRRRSGVVMRMLEHKVGPKEFRTLIQEVLVGLVCG